MKERCEMMVEFKNVSFKYDEDPDFIIKDLSFIIKKGEFVSIVGPSGCGKSTILRLICKLEKTDCGQIFVDGKNINELSGYIGYMPQKDLLMPWSTILENVCLPLKIKGISPKMANEQGRKMLENFGFEDYMNKYPKDLSGGMRQRVSFIRTILTGADLLLLDEPFSALDAITRVSMQEWLLDKWAKLNKTVLFVTHDVEEALFLSDRVFVSSGSPISKLKEINVPLSYPRNRAMLDNSQMLQIKEKLIDELKKKVKL